MNLNELLQIARVSRDSYNTHVKRAGFGFMKHGLGVGRNRYSLWHLVALQCFFSFFRSGARAETCSLWITQAAPEIRAVVEERLKSNQAMGWVFAYPNPALYDQHPDLPESEHWHTRVANTWPAIMSGDVERVIAISIDRALQSTYANIALADRAADLLGWDAETLAAWWPKWLPREMKA